MYIIDDISEKKLDAVTLLLTKVELQELVGDAESLIKDPSKDHHHISSADYQKEITICIYDEKNVTMACYWSCVMCLLFNFLCGDR